MQNGDLIFYQSWYQEVVLIPFPDDLLKYYLFSIGITSNYGLYYSTIDMSLDSGRGAVALKNIQLNNYQASDCLIALRHGNGRDWWILSRRWDSVNDEFYEHLVTPAGITGPFIQHVGAPTSNGIYFTSFSPSGNKLVGITARGLIELFDFDRCTGIISLDQTISSEVSMSPYPYYVGCAFSPNESYLYVSSQGISHPTYLVQYDITAPIISATADTLWTYTTTDDAGGALRLAPDGKIYLACAYYDGINFNYPYPDSLFNTINNNLSVINYPDSPGTACGFTPFSFNLGQGRCYWGLPNNPDYGLGPDTNSICDTVTALAEVVSGSESQLHVFYHPNLQIAFINAEGMRGKNYSLTVYELTGRKIYNEDGPLTGRSFTRDLKCDSFSKGMYIVTLRTESGVFSKKFIKQ